MLILKRRVGETITIGDDVRITVVGVKSNQVILGTVAPDYAEVHRSEIKEKINRERLEHANV